MREISEQILKMAHYEDEYTAFFLKGMRGKPKREFDSYS